jgi:hypothetical protein
MLLPSIFMAVRMKLTHRLIPDCHAEIISRRCLCDFLYRQLEVLPVNPVESIFTARDDGRGYRLKVSCC